MIGFYAGSFDPFTNGHLSIVKKSTKCFDKVIIGIGKNAEKKSRFDKQKMKEAIEKVLKEEEIQNAEVIIYDGLTSKEAKAHGAEILIRGLRNGTDYQYEETIAEINDEYSGLDTCYFRAGNLGYLSSSMVMELYIAGENITKFVPKAVAEVLMPSKGRFGLGQLFTQSK